MSNRAQPYQGLWVTQDIGRSDFQTEIALQSLAAEHGLAPEVVDVGDDWFTSRHTGRPIADFDPFWTLEQRIDVRDRTIRLLTDLFELGVHHRDASGLNITIDHDGSLKLIDFEWAIRQEAPCSFDLYGPEASGVPAPDQHQELGFSVWWRGSIRPLSSLFGPLP